MNKFNTRMFLTLFWTLTFFLFILLHVLKLSKGTSYSIQYNTPIATITWTDY